MPWHRANSADGGGRTWCRPARAGGNVAAEEPVSQGLELRGAGRSEGSACGARRHRQTRFIDLGENVREGCPPAGIARKGRRIERRLVRKLGLGDLGRARQRTRRQAGERRLLGRHDGCDQPQKALQLVPVGELAQALGAAAEDGAKIGQPNGIALGDVAERVLAIRRRGILGLVAAQGLPTSWRNHLRWCFQAQPPLTEPRVMARKVPFTQIAA